MKTITVRLLTTDNFDPQRLEDIISIIAVEIVGSEDGYHLKSCAGKECEVCPDRVTTILAKNETGAVNDKNEPVLAVECAMQDEEKESK